MSSHLVTQADDGKTIEVRQGDLVTLRLPENPTTGYRWSLDEHDALALEPAEKPKFEPASPAIGAGGIRTFTFLAKTVGESSLALSLRRSWERPTSGQKTFSVKIRIRE